MSEYIVVDIDYTDPACIKAALEELGYIYEEHKVAANLIGYEGSTRQQKANIIIRKKHVGSAANDVGFRQKEDGSYELIISEYDQREGSKSHENLMVKMKAVYTKHKHLKKLKQMGKVIKSIKTMPDGKIKIKAKY